MGSIFFLFYCLLSPIYLSTQRRTLPPCHIFFGMAAHGVVFCGDGETGVEPIPLPR
jgi:hypothetical protein